CGHLPGGPWPSRRSQRPGSERVSHRGGPRLRARTQTSELTPPRPTTRVRSFPTMNATEPAGLLPATVTPFNADMQVDFPALEAHLGATAAAPGVRGLVVNGHIGEIL